MGCCRQLLSPSAGSWYAVSTASCPGCVMGRALSHRQCSRRRHSARCSRSWLRPSISRRCTPRFARPSTRRGGTFLRTWRKSRSTARASGTVTCWTSTRSGRTEARSSRTFGHRATGWRGSLSTSRTTKTTLILAGYRSTQVRTGSRRAPQRQARAKQHRRALPHASAAFRMASRSVARLPIMRPLTCTRGRATACSSTCGWSTAARTTFPQPTRTASACNSPSAPTMGGRPSGARAMLCGAAGWCNNSRSCSSRLYAGTQGPRHATRRTRLCPSLSTRIHPSRLLARLSSKSACGKETWPT